MTVDAALDELFATSLEDFIQVRERLAKALKAEGDKAGAAQVKAQHKPTQAAHVLNQLARTARPELERLFEAGRALATGKAFHEALERQRAALEAVKQKMPIGELPVLLPIVQGAMADAAMSEAILRGRFSKLPDAPVGFFGLAPGSVVPSPPVAASAEETPASAPIAVAPPAPVRDLEAEARVLRAAEDELRMAETEVKLLELKLAEAKRRVQTAEVRVTQLKAGS